MVPCTEEASFDRGVRQVRDFTIRRVTGATPMCSFERSDSSTSLMVGIITDQQYFLLFCQVDSPLARFSGVTNQVCAQGKSCKRVRGRGYTFSEQI